MATLTTTPLISPSSLSVNGTTKVSATISWTCPTVPTGAIISSCILTGMATATMSKGSATITVRGNTITSGSTFTRDLGTDNTINSVSVTVTGGNKNANGTVTFSNLVYTVTYEVQLPTYTITFLDWDGTILKTEEVMEGNSASAPSEPIRNGYDFIGWDISFSNITSNLTITAQYSKIVYTPIRVKEDNKWLPIRSIYKKTNNIWTLQNEFEPLFTQNKRYKKQSTIKPIPTAIFYSDGTFIFSSNDAVYSQYGSIVATYTNWEEIEIASSSEVPWYNYRHDIKKLYFMGGRPKKVNSWFANCSNLTLVDLSGLDISNLTTLSAVFYACSSLESIDLSFLDTSNITDMQHLFCQCSNLASINLNNINTDKVTTMSRMFEKCTKLQSIDLTSFNMNNVQQIYGMFTDCENITIYVRTEADGTKIKNSANFPKSATIIVGSPT